MPWVRSTTCLVVAVVLQALPAGARPPARQTAAQPSPARSALAAGRAAEALKLAEGALRQDPLQLDANEIRIAALLSLGKIDLALGAYDQFASRAGKDVRPWLREIAIAELRQLGADRAGDRRLRAAALERLARAGDKAARADLEREVSEHMLTPEGLSADAALARLGDAAAAARIARMASSEAVRDKSVVAAALQQAGAKRYAYALVPLLRDASPVTRMAAASAVAALGYGEAISALRPLLTDPFGPVRTAAAVALRQLGDRSGDKVLADGARGTAPDQPIVAMEAAGAAPGEETVAAVTSLLAHKDPLVRLRAAEVLGRAGLARPACRAALEDLLASADAGIRQEAARVFELLPAGDPQVARRLLRDPNPWVRLYAAGTLEPPPQSGGHDAGGSRVQGSVW